MHVYRASVLRVDFVISFYVFLRRSQRVYVQMSGDDHRVEGLRFLPMVFARVYNSF